MWIPHALTRWKIKIYAKNHVATTKLKFEKVLQATSYIHFSTKLYTIARCAISMWTVSIEPTSQYPNNIYVVVVVVGCFCCCCYKMLPFPMKFGARFFFHSLIQHQNCFKLKIWSKILLFSITSMKCCLYYPDFIYTQ